MPPDIPPVPDPPATSAPVINIDFGPMLDLLRQIADAVNPTVFVPAALHALGQLIYTAMRNLFVALWNATLLGIPHDVTDQFGPVVAMMPKPGALAVSGLVLAVALLGVRTYVRGLTGRGGILDEILGRIVLYLAVLSLLPWIIWRAIEIEQSIARGVAVSAIDSIIPTAAPVDGMTIVTLMLMFVFGVRLWCKLASNVVHVCVAIIWSPVALVCGLIPESSWVAGVWVREFTGRLAGAVLATIATAVGLALALGHPGLLATAGGVAGFMAAHDLVDWLARTPGSHMGGILGMGLRLAAVGSGGGAAGAAAQAAAMRAFDRSEQARATEAFYSFD